jgi:hypothetical protein
LLVLSFIPSFRSCEEPEADSRHFSWIETSGTMSPGEITLILAASVAAATEFGKNKYYYRFRYAKACRDISGSAIGCDSCR